MSAHPVVSEKEFEFTEDNFNFLTQLVYEYAGIHITTAKRELVYGRIAKRLRKLGLNSFDQYCALLKSGDRGEFDLFINAITTNVTSFFRENHHFEFLKNELIPDLLKKQDGKIKPRLRAWSAGCSSGKEPYSIAMVLKETIPDIQRWDAKVLATDLDSNILDTAKKGIYPIDQVKDIPVARCKKWIQIGHGANSGTAKISDELKELVSFRKLNLNDYWPMKGLFDFVFYRNVAIYFDKPTKIKLLDRIADKLAPEGYLFVGHSESMLGLSDRFESVGRTIHRKIC